MKTVVEEYSDSVYPPEACSPPLDIPGPASADAVHPLASFHNAFCDVVEAPEYVVDDFLTAGTAVVAGERGLGKTSTLVPLVLAPTGLLERYPLEASIRRQVIYIAEDIGQVKRIIAAMRANGLITATADEFNEWFKLVEAKRMKASYIADVVPEYDDLWTPNEKVDGSIYLAPPVVVLDTTNATIDLDNISDNAEVSDAVATLRQRFGAICLVLVGHVSKASRSDARQLSFVGAGSWEGDTQQSIYLVSESDQRYMVLGKRRFEVDATEYLIRSHISSFEAIDRLGRTVEIRCFYGIPEASSEEAKQKAKEEAQVAAATKSWNVTLRRIKGFLEKNPGSRTGKILTAVTGKNTAIQSALNDLVGDGLVRVEDGPNKAKFHYPDFGKSWEKLGEGVE